MDLPSTAIIDKVINDRYEVLEQVGHGIFGAVFKAWHRQMEKEIAVKVLFQQLEQEDRGFQRFHREAQAISALMHPHIVKVYDFGVSTQGRPYMVMDYVEGHNLRDILKAKNWLPQDRAIFIFAQIVDALGHMHDSGFLHRDIKPDNIIVHDTTYQKDFATLVDFGIAKRLNEPREKRLTVDGTVVGTPAYMSPEQIMGNEIDNRSDIYSFGVLMYVTLTGILPVQGKNPVDTMTKHVTEMPLDMELANPAVKISPELKAVVKKSMAKSPEDRQQSMAQLHKELKDCLKK